MTAPSYIFFALSHTFGNASNRVAPLIRRPAATRMPRKPNAGAAPRAIEGGMRACVPDRFAGGAEMGH
ncbi:hypothetical protein [Cupriavidus necator]|uniref:hypothetical protein n=1 Tax=Cupriavidus necator TaxID=106590 RepID=UPI00339D53DE